MVGIGGGGSGFCCGGKEFGPSVGWAYVNLGGGVELAGAGLGVSDEGGLGLGLKCRIGNST